MENGVKCKWRNNGSINEGEKINDENWIYNENSTRSKNGTWFSFTPFFRNVFSKIVEKCLTVEIAPRESHVTVGILLQIVQPLPTWNWTSIGLTPLGISSNLIPDPYWTLAASTQLPRKKTRSLIPN